MALIATSTFAFMSESVLALARSRTRGDHGEYNHDVLRGKTSQGDGTLVDVTASETNGDLEYGQRGHERPLGPMKLTRSKQSSTHRWRPSHPVVVPLLAWLGAKVDRHGGDQKFQGAGRARRDRHIPRADATAAYSNDSTIS